MIEATITGFDITNLVEFFKNYKGLKTLEWWHKWDVGASSGPADYYKLYHFLYTNPMRRIRTIMTITVILEFKSKSEVKLLAILSGSKRGSDFGAQEFLESRILHDLKQEPDADWIIKQLSS